MNLNQLCKTSPKKNLDSNDLKNYRPILNLSFLSKLTKRVIIDRLLSHLSAHNLMSKFVLHIAGFILVKLLSYTFILVKLLSYTSKIFWFCLMLVVPMHFFSYTFQLLLIQLITIFFFTAYNTGLVFHQLL